MRTALYGVLVALMVVGLAACGGAPEQAPASSETTIQTSTIGGFEFLHYAVKLTGAANIQAEGATQAIVQNGTQRFVPLGGADLGFQTTLQLPTAAQVGIYTLAADGGDYRVQISTAAEQNNLYSASIDGTLEITSSDPLQGRFDYNATNAAGEILTVTGSFYEVIYTYSATVSGDITASIPPGQASAVVFGDVSALTLQTPDSVFNVTFYLPRSVASGTYSLSANAPDLQDAIGVMINNNGETSVTYDQGVVGTLSLTEVGQQFTGAFKVIAASADGKNITVEGAFEEVPLLAAEGG